VIPIPESEIVETGFVSIRANTLHYTFHRGGGGALECEMFIVPREAGAPASFDSADWEQIKIALNARWDALLCKACFFEAVSALDGLARPSPAHTCKPLDSTVEVARESLKVNGA
jgi:hypothetical protein